MSINTITLVGRAGRDPETRFFESGSSDAQKLLDLSAEMETLQADLEKKEMRWLELSEFAEE